MRTIELTTIANPIEDLLDRADTEEILLRRPNGEVFLLTAVTDAAEAKARCGLCHPCRV
jgi:hypothetical protein